MNLGGLQGQVKEVEQYRSKDIEKIFDPLPANSGFQAAAVMAAGTTDGEDIEIFLNHQYLARTKICSLGSKSLHIGTGFLIEENLIITNNHVLNELDISTADVVFDYVGSTKRNSLPAYKIEEVLVQSDTNDLDVAVLRLPHGAAENRGSFYPTSYKFDVLRDLYMFSVIPGD